MTKNNMKICPSCGSNVLKRFAWYRDPDTGEWVNCGYFHEYLELEPGHYICECGTEFFIRYDENKKEMFVQ